MTPDPPSLTQGVTAVSLRTRPDPPVEGQYKVGVSGNKGGRPKGFAAYVRKRTRDGRMLVDWAVDVVKGKPLKVDMVTSEGDVVTKMVRPAPKIRMQALAWLADRGWGKAAETLDVNETKVFVIARLHESRDPLAARETVLDVAPEP